MAVSSTPLVVRLLHVGPFQEPLGNGEDSVTHLEVFRWLAGLKEWFAE